MAKQMAIIKNAYKSPCFKLRPEIMFSTVLPKNFNIPTKKSSMVAAQKYRKLSVLKMNRDD